jgi:hypothetical protein
MARLVCPQCAHVFDVSHSAFVTGREGVEGEFRAEEYHPDKGKRYKTPEKVRRVAMAYYWKNKAAVLAREKRRRQQQQKHPVCVSIKG